MSGVKGENSIKLFGTDLKTMETKATEIERVMQQIQGVKDLGIFRLVGQPNLLIQVDREASARYGLQVADVNAVVQAAVGGQAVTQVYEGERLFDLVVRFLPEFRQDVDAIGNILVSTPDGARIPLKQVASITTQTGAFIIYRENNERYIPIKFSVRDRDLESTVEEAQARLAKEVHLPDRYRMEWAGQYDQLKGRAKTIGDSGADQSGHHFVSACTSPSIRSRMRSWFWYRPLCARRRRGLARGHPHEFQYLSCGRRHFDAWSGHPRWSIVDLPD